MLGAPSLGLKISSPIEIILLSCRIFSTASNSRHRSRPTLRGPSPRYISSDLKEPYTDALAPVTPASKTLAPTAHFTPRDFQIRDDLEPRVGYEDAIAQGGRGRVVKSREHHQPIPPISSRSITRVEKTWGNRYGKLRNVIGTTQSLEAAWTAYEELVSLPLDNRKFYIPFTHYHRLARLLASTEPPTRTLFMRLLTLLSALRKDGGVIELWEWNALMDLAAKGWRKTRQEDYRAALSVYKDMTAVIEPDIHTYTALLYIAARTMMSTNVRHASALLKQSKIPPNHATHLTLLRYFGRAKKVSGIRSTIMRMKEQNLELGLDGINACINAYARAHRMEVASTVYRVLRHHETPEAYTGENDIDEAIQYLKDVEGIEIAENIIPDRVSYTSTIQGLAYHGDLMGALQVFTHMLTTPDIEPFSPRVRGENRELAPVHYPISLPVFRALFLGFFRHAKPPLPELSKFSYRLKQHNNKKHSDQEDSESPWTLWSLDSLFKAFLDLPDGTRASERTIYWILVSFATLSGNDRDKMREVYEALQRKFGGRWGGRIKKIRVELFGETQEQNPIYAEKTDEAEDDWHGDAEEVPLREGRKY